jgi:short-subunit dehydrogenase
MQNWQKKWAVVTGASAGIGKAFCSELAAGGTNLVLVARRRDRLSELAATLSAKHSIKTEICPADLAQNLGPEEVFAFTQGKGIEVDLLINNAGLALTENSQPRLSNARSAWCRSTSPPSSISLICICRP